MPRTSLVLTAGCHEPPEFVEDTILFPEVWQPHRRFKQIVVNIRETIRPGFVVGLRCQITTTGGWSFSPV